MSLESGSFSDRGPSNAVWITVLLFMVESYE